MATAWQRARNPGHGEAFAGLGMRSLTGPGRWQVGLVDPDVAGRCRPLKQQLEGRPPCEPG